MKLYMDGSVGLHYVGMIFQKTVSLGPEMIENMVQQVRLIQQRMKAAQDRQKLYVDLKRKPMEFVVGDKVFLVSPTKGVMRFGRKGKLSPKFIGLYEILERVGTLAYRLALPMELHKVHDVFHVSQLNKYVHDPSHIIQQEKVQIDPTLSYEEVPVKLLHQSQGNKVKSYQDDKDSLDKP